MVSTRTGESTVSRNISKTLDYTGRFRTQPAKYVLARSLCVGLQTLNMIQSGPALAADIVVCCSTSSSPLTMLTGPDLKS